MNIDKLVISNEEKAVFVLRSLYEEYGYSHYKMNKFEEYDLYVRNKDFLVSDNVITFTDTSGKLMALKPDVTLSIVKNGSDSDSLQKVYYNENVYRVSKGSDSFKELMQVGLECIGSLNGDAVTQVLLLALKSLESLSKSFVLDVSHMGVLSEVMELSGLSQSKGTELLRCVAEKNAHDLASLGGSGKLQRLLSSYGSAQEIEAVLLEIYKGTLSENAVFLLDCVKSLEEAGYRGKVRIDFSVLNDISYYNGIVFRGFVDGIASGLLSGGQYDNLMKKMGRRSGAIGFAVYLDMLDRFTEDEGEKPSEKPMLNIALPKGRLGEKVYAMFEKAGFECPSIREVNRKLIFENPALRVRYFWVKPSDVAIYVERGAADIGVCGKDILLEYNPEVYELTDLKLGKCKMAVAAMADFKDDTKKTLRVATKFSNITKTYYNSKGRDIDIIHLNGSIEIAPVLGLSDVIVDIVETGTTLRENNLKVFEDIVPISARLISNKASFKFKSELIEKVAAGLNAQTEG